MQMLPTGAGKVVNPSREPGLVSFFLTAELVCSGTF